MAGAAACVLQASHVGCVQPEGSLGFAGVREELRQIRCGRLFPSGNAWHPTSLSLCKTNKPTNRSGHSPSRSRRWDQNEAQSRGAGCTPAVPLQKIKNSSYGLSVDSFLFCLCITSQCVFVLKVLTRLL